MISFCDNLSMLRLALSSTIKSHLK
jgi:hypothetical protein